MGRRRRKVEAELIELVRSELAAIRTEVQSTLADSAAILTTRMRTELEQRMGEPSALAAGIQNVRETIAGRDSELVSMLRQVTETCESLAERVQLDRVERTALVDAVARLTTVLTVAGTFSFTAAPAPGRPTVIGGTVDPEPSPPPSRSVIETGPHDEIDLEAVAREPDPPVPAERTMPTAPPRAGRPVRPDGVEVRCRFGDRWVTGFEVCEVIRLDDVTRYRLRRRSDGSVIPTLFDEKDLRFFSTTFVEPR
jgi:hypothetical protein